MRSVRLKPLIDRKIRPLRREEVARSDVETCETIEALRERTDVLAYQQ